jgi:hypothetical protein
MKVQELERVLEKQKAGYGPDHIKVAHIKINLANAYFQVFDFEKSKSMNEEALPVLKNHYGNDHIQIAQVLSNQASTLAVLRDFNGASDALTDSERILRLTPEGARYLEHCRETRSLIDKIQAYDAGASASQTSAGLAAPGPG